MRLYQKGIVNQFLFGIVMRTIEEIRLLNTRKLSSRFKTNVEFAKKLGKPVTYVNNLISDNVANRKNIGDKTARHIESVFDLPRGWLDNDHSTLTNVSPSRDLISTVPLIGKVAAGEFKHFAELEHDQIERFISVQKDYKGKGFALRIEGDSMVSPTGRSYPDGAEAVFNAGNKSPNNGDLVLAKVCGRDEVTFKKFVIDAGRPYLMPLNPNYPRIEDEFIVLAVFEYAIVY